MRPVALLLIAVLAGCAHRRAAPDAFDDSPKPAKKADTAAPASAATPPVSFMVTGETQEPFEETQPVRSAVADNSEPVTSADEKRAFNNTAAGIPIVKETPAELPKPGTKPTPQETMARIDRELEQMESQSKPPPAPTMQELEEASSRRKPTTIERPDKPIVRDASKMGISILGGVGLSMHEGSLGDYAKQFSFGGQATWNPAKPGMLALDASFWHVGRTTTFAGTTVEQLINHVAVRVLVVKEFSRGFFTGGGGGPVLTQLSSGYRLLNETEDSVIGTGMQLGIDGTILAGIRFGKLEARLDLRVIGRGFKRLDFLPTFAAGVNF